MSVPWNCLLFSLTNLVSVSQIGKLRAARGRIKGDETTFARGQPRAFSLLDSGAHPGKLPSMEIVRQAFLHSFTSAGT